MMWVELPDGSTINLDKCENVQIYFGVLLEFFLASGSSVEVKWGENPDWCERFTEWHYKMCVAL